MKNKIFGIATIVLLLIVCILISIPFFKRLSLKQLKSNYLKEFVSIEEYNVSKNDESLLAQINLSIGNSGDMLIDSLPLKINYLDKDRKIIEADSIDLLETVNDVIIAYNGKTFTIDVTFPNGSEFIEPEIINNK